MQAVWLRLIRQAARVRRELSPGLESISAALSKLYVDGRYGGMVGKALLDPFFPLSLFEKHYLKGMNGNTECVAKRAEQLALFCEMYHRIRKDIARLFGNGRVTCADLDGDAEAGVSGSRWCSLCGECCNLKGTVPDPPSAVRYPGYWYAYLAGEGPIVQAFCPFLLELPARDLYICAIHRVRPLTCAAFGRKDCMERYPGRARTVP